MVYKAKNIDVDKFLEELSNMQVRDMYKQNEEMAEVTKYHEGYKRALWEVQSMFECSNYEKKEELVQQANEE